VIASYIRSKDYEGVKDETAEFFQQVLQLKPVGKSAPAVLEMAATEQP
jgi:hypothetical protein